MLGKVEEEVGGREVEKEKEKRSWGRAWREGGR